MKSFFAALQFLTVTPLPECLTPKDNGESVGEVLAGSVPYFPVVGLLIGVAFAGFDSFAAYYLPKFPACVLSIIFLLSITGGLHMDGLADTADGFFSSRSESKMLEIMRDSRIGPMGVMAIVTVILLKVSLLSSLPASLPPGVRFSILILMPLAGRCSIVIMMAVLPYVRSEGGLVTAFQGRYAKLNALWAIAFFCAVCWIAMKWVGVVTSLAVISLVALFSFYAYKKIGGYTGDVLGAVCEIGELVPLLVVLVFRQGSCEAWWLMLTA